MFQSAFDFLDRLLTGCTPRPSGVGSEKPWMPCLNGRFPVAMEVHNIGESGGCSVEICAIAPFSTSRWTFGILPASISGWITFQSAASHPTSSTLPLRGVAIGGHGAMVGKIAPLEPPYCAAANFSTINTKCCCGLAPAAVECEKFICFASSTAAALFGSAGCSECASTNCPDAVTNPNTQTGCTVAPDGTAPTTREIFCAPAIATAGPLAFIS